MTKKEKDLLLKDLCARLPYGVKVKIKNYDDTWKLLAIYTNGVTYAIRDIGYSAETCFEDCKPYLFPMSSMTEEQKEDMIKSSCGIGSDKNVFDWYNKNHFDYRGLIPMGLAKDATGLNIY